MIGLDVGMNVEQHKIILQAMDVQSLKVKPLLVKTPWIGCLWKIYLLRKQAGWECYSKERMLGLVYVMPWKRLG